MVSEMLKCSPIGVSIPLTETVRALIQKMERVRSRLSVSTVRLKEVTELEKKRKASSDMVEEAPARKRIKNWGMEPPVKVGDKDAVDGIAVAELKGGCRQPFLSRAHASLDTEEENEEFLLTFALSSVQREEGEF